MEGLAPFWVRHVASVCRSRLSRIKLAYLMYKSICANRSRTTYTRATLYFSAWQPTSSLKMASRPRPRREAVQNREPGISSMFRALSVAEEANPLGNVFRMALPLWLLTLVRLRFLRLPIDQLVPSASFQPLAYGSAYHWTNRAWI